MTVDGAAFAIIGALEAFPRRLAAREIKARGGELRRGLSRRTRYAVLGHRLTEGNASADAISRRIEEARSAGATLLSENAFLRLIGLAETSADPRELSTRQIVDRSGLDSDTFDRLRLFDAFETAGEPFAFRDLVAARQYAKLAADGVDWLGIVRAVRSRRHSGPGGVTSIRLARSGNDVLMQSGATLSELSGQLILGLPEDEPDPADGLFEAAREAEEAEDWARAARLYRRLAEVEPKDPVVLFNLSHALMKDGEWQEARRYLNKVLRLDPRYAEAWYNLAAIAREHGSPESAGRHLRQAIAADPGYPDPLYNLALLEFDAGSYEQAAKLWERYRELDPDSPWGKKAGYGLQLIGMITGSAPADEAVSESDRQLLAR